MDDEHPRSPKRERSPSGRGGSSSSRKRDRVQPQLVPSNAFSFVALLGDLLRIEEQTLAMAFAYMNRFKRFIRDSEDKDSSPVPVFLDDHTLALSSLSLASKATESPRRLRAILVPAWGILHPSSPPLTFPSELYDTLRSTLVAAELQLLRVLKFELRLVLPHEFLPRYLHRALDVVDRGEDYDSWSLEKASEDKVIRIMETKMGREVGGLSTDAMEDYELCCLYPARAVAAGCLWVALEDRGVHVKEGMVQWLDMVTGGRVDTEDVVEVVERMRDIRNSSNKYKGKGKG